MILGENDNFNIKELSDLTIAELAKRLGLSVQNLYQQKNPSVQWLVNVATSCGLKLRIDLVDSAAPGLTEQAVLGVMRNGTFHALTQEDIEKIIDAHNK